MGSQKQNLQGLLCREVWLLLGGLCQQPEGQPLFLQLSLASRSMTDLLVRHNKPEDTGMMSLAERSRWDSDHTPTIFVGVKEAQMLGTSNVQTYRETEHTRKSQSSD